MSTDTPHIPDEPAFEEPRLTIRRPPGPAFPGRRSLRTLAFACVLPLVDVASLAFSGNLTLPFRHIETLEAKMASKSVFFEDPEVERILMKHGIRVHVTRMGSREIANRDIEGYDFVFPSGQPAADLITDTRARQNAFAKTHRPFVSPIVPATYREYAQTLADHRVADGGARRPPGAARDRTGGPVAEAQSRDAAPLYYTLDMRRFLRPTGAKARWNARCLGKVQDWNPRTGELTLQAIAIFR
ncbi:hypothetical protein [Streptomyces sp. NPDC018031]|uniref:hypothetical protein n=1 Tax=Streptomyces sp. NPDC018031 TaxID=3365033 RepID=UPI00379278B7